MVVALVFLVGHATALFPESPDAGWGSAVAFTLFVFAYAVLSASGRRSTWGAFASGAAWVAPAWGIWLAMVTKLPADSWYLETFGFQFRLGLSDRGWGHAGMIWLLLWIGSILVMIAVALLARRLIFALFRTS